MAQPSEQTRLSIPLALLWVLLSTLLISGSATVGWSYYQYLKHNRIHDPRYTITTVALTGPEPNQLPSGYLVELLGLSVDYPSNLYAWEVDAALKRVQASPLISEAVVKVISPGTVYVDYTARKPVAYLGDYSNTAIDARGYLFPMEPFFTPKKLPILTLGLPLDLAPEELWGQQRAVDRFHLAMAFLQTAQSLICNSNCRIVKIDVSKADAQSYGRRQIIVAVEEMVESAAEQSTILRYYPYVLRLRTRDYEQALRQFLALRPRLWETIAPSTSEGPMVRYPVTIVDLRLPDLAYIQEG